MKHNWQHLFEHNDKEGPFPTFVCQNCGKFANGASMLQFPPNDSFNTKCKSKRSHIEIEDGNVFEL